MHPEHIIIAGAQKCGTSTLYRWLASHSAIGTAARRGGDGSHKELKFFDGPHWQKGFDWYFDQFPRNDLRSMDATPEYLPHDLAAQRISRVFPQAKVIVTLREPVRRSASQHYHYNEVLPQSAKWDWRRPGDSFEANIEAELSHRYDRWRGLIGRGLYAEQLRSMEQFIPRERMLVLVLEEWSVRPKETFATLMQFLELDDEQPPALRPHHRRQTREATHGDELLTRLRDLYRPANEELFAWLGREIPSWQESYSPGN